jgi:hypothetical protein
MSSTSPAGKRVRNKLTIKEARSILDQALADTSADNSPEAEELRKRLSGLNDADADDRNTIFAFARIISMWPPKPEPLPPVYLIPNDPPPPEPNVLAHLIRGGALSEYKGPKRPIPSPRSLIPEWCSLVDALTAGLGHEATVDTTAGRHQRALRLVGEASEGLDAVRSLALDLRDKEIRGAYEELERHIDRRVSAAKAYLKDVRGAGGKESVLLRETREGMRLAARRIRELCPKATGDHIELALAAAFGEPAFDKEGSKRVDLKSLLARRRKSAAVKAREKAKRAAAAKKRKTRPKPRP